MIDFNSLAPIISGAVGGAVSSGMLSGPITSLDDWWYYHFGKESDLKKQKAVLLNQEKLAQYKTDIFNAVKKIPAEDVQQPALNIIGPSLEASKYYIEAPELRKMFAKLVASSMDARKKDMTRSSFVEFVKQMDPIDAKLLSFIAKTGNTPVGRIVASDTNGSYNVLIPELLTADIPIDDNERDFLPASVENLARLNLINLSYTEILPKFNYTDNLSKLPEYLTAADNLKERQEIAKTNLLNYQEKRIHLSDSQVRNIKSTIDRKVEIKKGSIQISSLGNDFAQICL